MAKEQKPVGETSIFGKTNKILFGVAIGTIMTGFYLLGEGPADNPLSLTYAPILMVIGFCILVPVAIMYREKK